jgi:N-acetylglucosaminyldiphosphoundecaprenol N-acetyl-beta-D-mannosaminyltransferase
MRSARGWTRLQGVCLDTVGFRGASRAVARAIEEGRRLHIATVNLGFLTIARRSPAFASSLEGADLSVIDGRLLLWIVRLAGHRTGGQVTGHDLAWAAARLAARRGSTLMLLGGSPGAAAAAAARLSGMIPRLRAEGLEGGGFSEDGWSRSHREIRERIESLRPGVILVGLGAPKQERWLARNLPELPPAIGIGVGGVIDTLAGRLPRAPRMIQITGLESLFQLAIRPRRFGRRYLIDDPPTLLRALAEAARRRIARPGIVASNGGRDLPRRQR